MKNAIILHSKVVGIEYREFSGYGHFTFGSMQTEEFPELLKEAIK